jgi:Zinc-finger of C2H2 type
MSSTRFPSAPPPPPPPQRDDAGGGSSTETARDKYCEPCNKMISNGNILRHIRLFHNKERHFYCAVCDKAFQQNSHLAVHFKTAKHKKM